jgi:hypothetical protein
MRLERGASGNIPIGIARETLRLVDLFPPLPASTVLLVLLLVPRVRVANITKLDHPIGPTSLGSYPLVRETNDPVGKLERNGDPEGTKNQEVVAVLLLLPLLLLLLVEATETPNEKAEKAAERSVVPLHLGSRWCREKIFLIVRHMMRTKCLRLWK